MRNYKELIVQLERHIKFRDSFETSLNYWTRLRDKSGPREVKGQSYENLDMPRGSRDDTTLDAIEYNIQHYKGLMEDEIRQIEALQTTIDYSNESIRNSEDIYDKVAYLKYQKDEYGRKKYTLEDIADMLVYGVDRIKQISAEV